MVDGKSRAGSVAIGVLKALHLLDAENHPTTLDAICDWLATSENFYYDDWLTFGGRSAKEYIADILEDLRELGVVCTVRHRPGVHAPSVY
ncbi:hypothetical protein [Paraburkholderia rhynchosiae]|uniref:Uncharacterized protein n=1 Tax=Paraburkholderia rhynchosiae TaxID=487049 RepID=A0A6J5BNR1_9BURK|nr:hypothetical protein [Paraburkholderia rhynchosiae]CAB3711418.1 hypothetical protein LMG27174_04258 [Paraburkholderia rhynchosiae]